MDKDSASIRIMLLGIGIMVFGVIGIDSFPGDYGSVIGLIGFVIVLLGFLKPFMNNMDDK